MMCAHMWRSISYSCCIFVVSTFLILLLIVLVYLFKHRYFAVVHVLIQKQLYFLLNFCSCFLSFVVVLLSCYDDVTMRICCPSIMYDHYDVIIVTITALTTCGCCLVLFILFLVCYILITLFFILDCYDLLLHIGYSTDNS